jgi:hypothetical protein
MIDMIERIQTFVDGQKLLRENLYWFNSNRIHLENRVTNSDVESQLIYDALSISFGEK